MQLHAGFLRVLGLPLALDPAVCCIKCYTNGTSDVLASEQNLGDPLLGSNLECSLPCVLPLGTRFVASTTK